MPSLGGYFDHIMQRTGTQIMELCDWNSIVTFHQVRSKLPAQLAALSICETCSAPRWLKSRRQLKNQAVTIELPTQQTAEEPNEDFDAESSSSPFRGAGWQSKLRKRGRNCPRVACQQQFEDLLNSLVCWWLKLIGFKVYSTHWSCKGSSSTCAFPAQLKTLLS